MATGDVSGNISVEGGSIYLTVQGFTTGATYNFDWRGKIPGAFSSGTFNDGDTVTQAASGCTAIVVGNQSSGSFLVVKNLTLAGTIANALYNPPYSGAITSNTHSAWVDNTTGAIFYPSGGVSMTIPGPNTPYLTVTRQGYTATASASANTASLGTVADKVYLTTNVNVPYSTVTMPVNSGTWTGTLQDGETVTASISAATAQVVGNQSAGSILRVKNLSGAINAADVWTGGTSLKAVTSNSATTTTLTLPAKDELNTGTALITRLALAEYVYVNDNTGGGNSGTAPTITIPAGAIVNSGGGAQSSNALSNSAVTNSSTATYPNTMLRSASIPYKYLGPGSTFTVEWSAMNRFARNGQPLAAIAFIFTDGTVTRTQTVTSMSLSTRADAAPVYAVTDSTSNFTQGASIVCRAIAYPWVGNATNGVNDSSVNAWQNTNMAVSNHPVGICDKAGTYGVTYASVNSSTGNDSTGVASNVQATAEATPCLTIAGAWTKIAAYNNTNYSRNTVDASIVTLQGGSNLFGAASLINNPTCQTVIQPATGYTQATAQITGFSAGGRYSPKICRIYNVTIAPTSSTEQLIAFTADACPLIFDTCVITGTGNTTALVSSATNGKAATIIDNCTVSGYTGGISGGNDHIALYCRGTSIKDVASGQYAYGYARLVLKCTMNDNSGATAFDNWASPSGWTETGNIILAYNKEDNLTGTFIANSGLNVTDLAIYGNVIAKVGSGSSSVIDISAANITNVLVYQNTLAGQRFNSEGMLNSPYTNFAYVNNAMKYCAINYHGTHNSFDAHVALLGGTQAQAAAAVGNWWFALYQVGWAGNNREIRNTEQYMFDGVGSTSQTVCGYVNDQSYAGHVTVPGGSWSGTFNNGDVVYQVSTNVYAFADGTQTAGGALKLYGVNNNGTPDNSHNWVDATTGATFTPSAVPTTGATGGNYAPAATSILIGKIPAGLAVLPYDMNGVPINNAGLGSAGAIQYQLSTGTFFWWP